MAVPVEVDPTDDDSWIDLDLADPYESQFVEAWVHGHDQLRVVGHHFFALDYGAVGQQLDWMDVPKEWRWTMVKDLVETTRAFLDCVNRDDKTRPAK